MSKLIWPITAVACMAIAATGTVLVARSLSPAATTVPRAAQPVVKHTPSPSPAVAHSRPRPRKARAAAAPVSTSAPASASPEPVLLITCSGQGVTKPSAYTLACGDGNGGLSGLTWSSWTASGAAGSGEYYANDCIPDCAQGTFQYTPATVTLSAPVNDTPAFFADMQIISTAVPGGSEECTADQYGGMNC